MFEPSNAKAGGFQVDKDIGPRVIYSLIFTGFMYSPTPPEHSRVAGLIKIFENHLLRLSNLLTSSCSPTNSSVVFLPLRLPEAKPDDAPGCLAQASQRRE